MKFIIDALPKKFEHPIEKSFLSESFKNSIITVRFGIILGVILYSIFGILDQYMLPETKRIAWFIRFVAVVPTLLLILLLSFTSFFKKFFVPILIFTSLLLGFGIIFMIYFSNELEPGYKYYYTGLILVIIWIGTFSQLRFKHVSYAILCLVIGYMAVVLFKQDMVIGGFDNAKFPIFLNNSFFFISAAVLAFFSSNSFEKFKRHTFFQKEMIEQEKRKSDNLLLNILPVRVANDLKNHGNSNPQQFEHVTVFFSDIVGFTRLSANIEPEILIDSLNELFTAFDNIMEKNNCERIKTIGDAYLAVSGMPEEDKNHATNIARSALEIIAYCQERNLTNKIKWQIRIGIHSGKVVGGIVGIKKYIYDVFGDTINVASRMEANSDAMKINISETSYHLLKDEYKCIERSPLFVKGKGEMKMYYLIDTKLDSNR